MPVRSGAGRARKPENPPPVAGDLFCALGGTRTPNLLIRSQVLYPIGRQAQAQDRSPRFARCNAVFRFGFIDSGLNAVEWHLDVTLVTCEA